MLANRRNKKLTKNVSIEQQILALNKEEMEFKNQMLRKMEIQDQHFNRSMEMLQENMLNFTTVISKSIQMMSAAACTPNPYQFQQMHCYQAPNSPTNVNYLDILSNSGSSSQSSFEKE